MDCRDSFIFYRSFYEAISYAPEEDKLKILEAIIEYSLYGKEIDIDGVAKGMFILIKPQLDANSKRYENGKKGGRPNGTNKGNNQKGTEKKPNDNQNETKSKANDNVNVNVNENVNVNVNPNANDNAAGETEDELSSENMLTVFDAFENEFSRPLSQIELQQLLDFKEEFNDELILLALKEAVLNNARNFKYIQAILANWKQNGVRNVADAKVQIDKYNSSKSKNSKSNEKQPDWYANQKRANGSVNEVLKELGYD